RPDRRDARADGGDLPLAEGVSGPDEGEPRGDEGPGDGRGGHDRPRREGPRPAGRPQARPRRRPEGAGERDPSARGPPRRTEGDESLVEERDRGGDGSERVPRGELRDRRRGREAGPLSGTLRRLRPSVWWRIPGACLREFRLEHGFGSNPRVLDGDGDFARRSRGQPRPLEQAFVPEPCDGVANAFVNRDRKSVV